MKCRPNQDSQRFGELPWACQKRTHASRNVQAERKKASKGPMWTEADGKVLPAKAQRGDANAQSWLGAACCGAVREPWRRPAKLGII